MVDIVTRAGKGSPLTNNEVDANFTNLAEVSGVTGEPMGHEDRTTSTISFNASTRTFTIAPVNSSFTVWCKGKKVVVSSARTVTIPNTTGMYSIYFDSTGTLAAKSGYFTFSDEAPTAYIYWNATTGTAPYFGDERHGVVLDWQTHEYLHRTRGAAIANGFLASGYTLNNSATDAATQIAIESGTFFDEDMKIDIVSTATPTAGTYQQNLLFPAKIPVLHLQGTSWVMDAPTNFPFKQGTSRPQYNSFSGGVWSTTDVGNNQHATTWILATNNLTYPVIAIIGQSATDNLGEAEAFSFADLTLTGFPSVEFRPLYKLIYKASDGYANSVNAQLVSIVDLRSISAVGSVANPATDHGNLSGLSDDDHPQYLSVDTVRSGLTAAVKASFLPSQTGNDGKFLQTNGTATLWQALSSSNVTTALGFTPYNATNPSGFISGITSGMVTTALGFTPYNATNPSGYVNAAGARGAISVTGAGSYDSATGVINIVGGVTSFNTRTGAITLSSSDVTTALGFTPYNSTNPNGYLTGITSTQVTTALGYTPYNSSNPSGYITGITSGMVTTALGFTPYNNSNPSGYITSAALSPYLTTASAASTYLALSGGTLTGQYLDFSQSTVSLRITSGPGRFNIGDDDSVVLASAFRFYTGGTDGSTAYGDFRTNPATGNSIISAKTGALYFNYDHGTGGVVFSNGAQGTVGNVDASGNANFIGAITQNGSQVLHAGNYGSYSPTLTGTGASGTWGINITGTAATATSAPNYLPLAGGTLTGLETISVTHSTATTTTGSHLRLENPTGSQSIIGFTFAGVPKSSIRGDNDGNLILNSTNTFYFNYDLGTSSFSFRNGATGIFQSISGTTVNFPGTLQQGGNQVLHAGNYTNYANAKGGGWYGSGLPGSRWGGYSTNGGEISFGDGLPNANQMGILVDGCYVAGENNGFWSLPSDNTWSGRRGMYWDGTYLNFTTNSATASFTNALIGGNQIFHAGNYTGYDGIIRALGYPSASSDWNSLGNGYHNSVLQVDPSNFSSTSNGPTAASYSYGTLLNLASNQSSKSQIYISHAGNDLIFRGGWGTGSWQTWNKVLTNQNYNSYSPSLTGGGASGTWNINISGNAATATLATSAITLTSTQGVWNTGVINNVVGMLAWKNYGNSHVIFDASQSTSPSGTSISNTNPQNNWTGTFPTLMGWNGSNTYGVRVDSARVADSAGAVDYNALTNKGGGTGTYTTSGDYRAPIFYDSSDTNYYVDLNSNSKLYYLQILGSGVFDSSTSLNVTNNAYIYGRAQIIITGRIDNSNDGWALTSPRNGILFNVNSGGAQGAIGTTNFNLQYNLLTAQLGVMTAYSAVSPSIYWAASDPHTRLNGNLIAPIFYDSNDTSYYVDPASSSLVNNMYANGQLSGGYSVGRPASLNGSNWAARIGANDVYLVMNSLNETASYASAIQSMRTSDAASFPLLLNPNGGNVTVRQNSDMGFALGVNGIMYSNTSSRAPIFYDSNDTTYYIDPASFTYVFGGIINNGAHGNSYIQNRLLAANNGAATGDVQMRMWCSEPGVSWDYGGFGYNVLNDGGSPGGFGRPNTGFGQAYMRMSPSGDWYFYNVTTGAARYTTMQLHSTGYVTAFQSSRAPLFYDNDNTSYYLDPNSTSNVVSLNAVNLFANSSISLAGNGSGNDPYGTMAVTEPANANNYSYYGLTRAGNIGAGFGITGTNGALGLGANCYWFGSATSGAGGVLSGAAWIAFSGSSFVAAGNVTAYSDERVKTNWRGYGVDFVQRLAEVKHGTYDRTDQELTQDGVSAQSLQKLLPHSVMGDESLSVAYGNAALVSAVELAKDNVELRARIERLESLINKLIGD